MESKRVLTLGYIWLGISGVAGFLTLRHESTVLIPSRYEPIPTYEYNKDVIRSCDVDPRTGSNFLYCGGQNVIDISDYTTVTNPVRRHYVTLNNGTIQDIEACGNWLGVVFRESSRPSEGRVYIYDMYDPVANRLNRRHEIVVGSGPNSLTWTSDCRRLVIAVGGAPIRNIGIFEDPPGIVTLITFIVDPNDVSFDRTDLDFSPYNNRFESTYEPQGLRWVFRGQNSPITNTWAQDIEPSHVAIDEYNTRAYVSLPTTNAFAVIDLTKDQFINLYPAGTKDWSQNFLDTATSDNGINLRSWGIRGLNNPEELAHVNIDGLNYIISSNKGQARSFTSAVHGFNWQEYDTGRNLFRTNRTSSSLNPTVATGMNTVSQLGSLRFSAIDGLNATDGRIQFPHVYGARGLTLTRSPQMTEASNTGQDLEQNIASEFAAIFNGDGERATNTPEQTFDSRSVFYGPEPTGLSAGEIAGQLGVFLGVSKPGIVLVYGNDGSTPDLSLESIHYSGGTGATWEQLYAQGLTRDVGISEFEFVPPGHSPNGEPLLIVIGRVSGTAAIYSVYDSTEKHTKRAFVNQGKPAKWSCYTKHADLLSCTSTVGCYTYQQRCDGKKDCKDGSDEQGCSPFDFFNHYPRDYVQDRRRPHSDIRRPGNGENKQPMSVGLGVGLGLTALAVLIALVLGAVYKGKVTWQMRFMKKKSMDTKELMAENL